MAGKRHRLVSTRKAAGFSQERLAEAVGVERSTVMRWERGQTRPQPWARPKLARTLGISDQSLSELLGESTKPESTAPAPEPIAGEAEEVPSYGVHAEGGAMQRRKTLKLSLAVAVSPEVLGRVLSDAAAEAMEFTQVAALSAVGQGTLEHLELVVSDLNRAYLKNPPAEQFLVAQEYRSRVNELIRGRHTLKESQALYVYASWLSELLAWLAYDLGDLRTAQAYALDCYTYADEVGHGELCGWATNAMAPIAMDLGNPNSATRATMRGVVKISTNHPLAVRLRAHVARAYARLGQREPCEIFFDEAQQLNERLPARAPCRFTVDTGIHASYAMTAFPAAAYLWLKDFEKARTHGEAALAAIESAPPGSKSPYRQTQVHFNLAMALVGLGTPDDAVTLGSQAIESMRMVPSLVALARDLDRVLVSHYPKLRAFGKVVGWARSRSRDR